jgi:uroporphyrinogen III methyltransferase / synthase
VAEAGASPLAGKRIVVTRAVEQSSALFEKLSASGAIPISLPVVSFAPPPDSAPLDAALLQLQGFDWIIFTSANAVHAVAARSRMLGRDLHQKDKPPWVAAVGPATRQEAENAGFSIDYMAKTHLGVALAEELGARLQGKNVFLPRSDHANRDLPQALRRLGARLTEVVAYRTLPPDDLERQPVAQTLGRDADAVLFFSPSAVQNFADWMGREQLRSLQNRVAFAAVGPVTARALRESGVHRLIVARDTTAAAVVEMLENHFAEAGEQSTAGAGHT